MPRYAHPDVLDNGLAYVSAHCDKAILITAYTTVYATANGANKIAECSLVSGDFALSGTEISGTATAGGAATLTDSSKSWTTNDQAGRSIDIISGTGAGQSRTIASNTATQVTVSAAWTTNPSTDSVYRIASRMLKATLMDKSAGNAAQALADGSGMHVAFVDTTTSKVLLVLEESSNQAITSGNPVVLKSNPTYVSNQPTA